MSILLVILLQCLCPAAGTSRFKVMMVFPGENPEVRAADADEPGGAADGGAAVRARHARHAAGRHPGEDADQEHRPAAPGAAL